MKKTLKEASIEALNATQKNAYASQVGAFVDMQIKNLLDSQGALYSSEQVTKAGMLGQYAFELDDEHFAQFKVEAGTKIESGFPQGENVSIDFFATGSLGFEGGEFD